MESLIYLVMLYLLVGCNGLPKNKEMTHADTAPTSKDSPVRPVPIPVPDSTTLNGEWFLQPVLPSDTATGRIPTLVINLNKSSFSGNTGCNRMSGTFTRTDTSFQFSDKIMLTKMACPGYNEKEFIESLLRATRYKFDNGVLVFLQDMTELSRWTRKIEQQPKTNKT